MSVLLLITDLQRGGTPIVVRELAIRLKAVGVDIQVACLSRWGPIADDLHRAGIAVTALNAKGVYDVAVIWRLTALIRQDRIHTVFSFLMHANAIAAAASLRLPDVQWIQSIQTTQPWPRWHWLVQRLAQRAAERVVVPSPSVARVANQWAGVPEEKIVVIPNAIDPAEWTGAQSIVPAGESRPYPITFLGRLDPIKDVPTLVQAVAQLSPLVHLHVYGEGSDRPRIEQAIARFNAPVTLHGVIESPQAVLVHSGMLVLPSLAEGFGLVLIEAMAAGVPVVATSVPGIRDVIRHEHNGLLASPADAISLAACIGRIVRDRPLRQRLIGTAAAEVREKYTWEVALRQYQSLLKPFPG